MPRKEKKGSFGGKEKKRKRETAAGQTAAGTQQRGPGNASGTLAESYSRHSATYYNADQPQSAAATPATSGVSTVAHSCWNSTILDENTGPVSLNILFWSILHYNSGKCKCVLSLVKPEIYGVGYGVEARSAHGIRCTIGAPYVVSVAPMRPARA